MAEFKADVSVRVICDECGRELDSSINENTRSVYHGCLEVDRCDCRDEDFKSDGYSSRDVEVDELKEELAAMKERVKELESEVESLEEYARDRALST